MTSGENAAATLDADRRLALSYVAMPARARLSAFWSLDASLGAVLAGGREPMISRIKLAWWRDALEALDRGDAPAEPLLQALASEVVPFGIAGAELAEVAEGWSMLTDPGPLSDDDLVAYARGRGATLFALSARLLGDPDFDVMAAAEGWALVDLARHSGDASEIGAARNAAAERLTDMPGRWPKALRPLGMLAVLAARDAAAASFEPQGTPGRMWAMLGHRLTGRAPGLGGVVRAD